MDNAAPDYLAVAMFAARAVTAVLPVLSSVVAARCWQ